MNQEIAAYSRILLALQCFHKTFEFKGLIKIGWYGLYSLPHNKFLDWFKLKAVADDKSNVAEKLKFVLGRVENISHNVAFSKVF